MTAAITSILARTADGSSIPLIAVDQSGAGAGPYAPVHTIADAAGAPYSNTNPLPISVTIAPPTTTQIDRSANKPALPVIGGNFAAAGPWASYVLIATIAANPSRAFVEVLNASGGRAVVILDDGTAGAGIAPANATAFPLDSSTLGGQGGSWSSSTFRGRVQIFAPSSGAIVAAYEN